MSQLKRRIENVMTTTAEGIAGLFCAIADYLRDRHVILIPVDPRKRRQSANYRVRVSSSLWDRFRDRL